jgi:hypothetical protein
VNAPSLSMRSIISRVSSWMGCRAFSFAIPFSSLSVLLRLEAELDERPHGGVQPMLAVGPLLLQLDQQTMAPTTTCSRDPVGEGALLFQKIEEPVHFACEESV